INTADPECPLSGDAEGALPSVALGGQHPFLSASRELLSCDEVFANAERERSSAIPGEQFSLG
ncbi:MAG: hypothetical protein WBE81_13210, partial [Pseudolabrys sp.]